MSVTVDDPDITLFDGSDWREYTNAPGGWYGGTYHETCDDRDDLTITFKGSGIRVYGAKRPTYGYYFAEMDGETRRFFNAHSEDDEIPALLYEMSGMEDKDHSLWMMNQQNYGGQRTRSCWGIDYMVVTSGSGDSAAPSDEHASDPPPSALGSVDPSAEATETADAGATSSEAASASASSTPIGQAGHPITASSSSVNPNVPNLSNFTQPPSADEVNAPNTTWVSPGAITAVTGQPGVYSNQPLPVYTGQSLNTAGTPPNLPQQAFATGAMAGTPNVAWPAVDLPGMSLCLWLVGMMAVRGLGAR